MKKIKSGLIFDKGKILVTVFPIIADKKDKKQTLNVDKKPI